MEIKKLIGSGICDECEGKKELRKIIVGYKDFVLCKECRVKLAEIVGVDFYEDDCK